MTTRVQVKILQCAGPDGLCISESFRIGRAADGDWLIRCEGCGSCHSLRDIEVRDEMPTEVRS